MTIGMAKQLVRDNKGAVHSFRFRGARNQIEEFEGMITDIYPAIFIIKLNNQKIRSFSYSDVLIDNLKILN